MEWTKIETAKITAKCFLCALTAWCGTTIALAQDTLSSVRLPMPVCSLAPASARAADSLSYALPAPKRPWLALGEAMASNGIVWTFDRYVNPISAAKISAESIKENFRVGFVYDFDPFLTNQFSHPYQGNIYYNAARSNGLNFWQSVPYACLGSLTWEWFLETEPPGLNDVVATSVGGTAIGEVFYRMSALPLDDSSRGGERVAREAIAFIFNPAQGFNRLLSGDLWRVRHQRHLYHNWYETPVHLSVGAGYRYLANRKDFGAGVHVPYIELSCHYGDIFNAGSKPYDVFQLDAALCASTAQAPIEKVSICGKLYSNSYEMKHGQDFAWGIFQHYNYLNSNRIDDNMMAREPYRVTETACFGLGASYRLDGRKRSVPSLRQDVYASAILLGAIQSDYLYWIARDYNYGSGFSLKSHTDVSFGRRATAALNVHAIRLYTWRGYTAQDLYDSLYGGKGILNMYTQGDKSKAWFCMLSPSLQMSLYHNLRLNASANFYFRSTRYTDFDNVSTRYADLRIGLDYLF